MARKKKTYSHSTPKKRTKRKRKTYEHEFDNEFFKWCKRMSRL